MRNSRLAFTLVELLLVLAIIGVVVALASPYFVNSLKGTRLSTAARTVARAGRYARSMAVLSQQQVEMVIHIDQGLVTVGGGLPPARDGTPAEAAEPVPIPAEDAARPDPDAPPTNAPAAAAVGRMEPLSQRLDGVKIESVEVGEGGDALRQGIVTIRYQRNGRCVAYRVRLVDDRGEAVVVSVDELASARLEKEP